ncbi:MAG: Flp pilus assembly complex ATPase component TadA [Anaerolineae bacterium]|nr:Flp pilus assembly complex ATPase component TadA [Anaerolineae bacterium]
MPDQPDDNHEPDFDPDYRQLRPDADKGREPRMLAGRLGQRMVSLAALVERVETAFREEHGTDSPALQGADTTTKRLKLVLESAEYIFSVESLNLSNDDRAHVVSSAYSDLFSYGPLDPLLLDDRVTTIALDGANKAAVRYGHGGLLPLGPLFQDQEHYERILRRMLADGGAELRPDQPIMEVGLVAGDRPVCLNLVAPPVTVQLTADIRVHPKAAPTLDTLAGDGFMTVQAADLLRSLAASKHGIMIVGEPVTGKTTLLGALAQLLPQPEGVIAVERAGELRLPSDVTCLSVRWPVGDHPGVTFGEQIGHALEQSPACVLLDEVRADEPHSIAPLLDIPNAPRQIWSFRGTVFAKRLQSALSMLARRADFGQGEEMVRALYDRLPFVLSVLNLDGKLRLWSVAEWQFRDSPDYPTYVLLMQTEGGELKFTGERPVRDLSLPDGFWG